MIEVVKYSVDFKQNWNSLLEKCRTDNFLFNRDFMDYHANRYTDNSFLFYRNGKLSALLPGNIDNDVFYSHQGLTYGGIISTPAMTAKDILETFYQVNYALKSQGIKQVIYKPLPYIYLLQPAQEDIYALHRLNAVKVGCNISSTIFNFDKLPFNESRKAGLRKAIKNGIIINQSESFAPFWELLTSNLFNSYKEIPVHSFDEIILLKTKFPDNIKLYCSYLNNEIIAGCVLFIFKNAIHVQYIVANRIGKDTGALDLLFHELINKIYADKHFFDFGHSNQNMGSYLNENLIFQKEGFGARGVVYDTYKYNI